MPRYDFRRTTVLVAMVCIAVLAAGCGGSSSVSTGSVHDAGATSDTRPSMTIAEAAAADPSAEIMAAAANQLVTVDNTFGSGSRPFSTFLVLGHTDPKVGAIDGSSGAGSRPLTGTERAAIERRLSSLGEVMWIDDPTAYQNDDLGPTTEGGVIIVFGQPTIDTDTALVPISLSCGALCGIGLTYSLAQDATGAWTVDGIEGPVTVS